MAESYTAAELMVAAAAREMRDGEIDRHGNLDTSYIGDPDRPTVKLPGSGGAANIAALARRFVIIMPHDRRRFRDRVDFITSPGFGDGDGRRERVGLGGGGPAAIISTLGVFGFQEGEAILRSYHPFTSVDEIRDQTGWPLHIAPDIRPTPTPTSEELAVIRAYDPREFWTA
ncbi:MAG TPA: CoA-transferase [Chloroflexota bacterium]|nr:CoA-transferase [Chloroflexota bacterium]